MLFEFDPLFSDQWMHNQLIEKKMMKILSILDQEISNQLMPSQLIRMKRWCLTCWSQIKEGPTELRAVDAD